jgi:hypothetical protein
MTNEKELIDFGERVIVEAMKDDEPTFSYVQAGPERLIPRPLSPEELACAQKSSLDTTYVPPSKRPRM